MIKKSLVTVLALIIVAGIFGLIRANVKRGEMQKLLDQLRSEDVTQREAAAKTLVERKQEVLSSPNVIAGIENIVKEYSAQESRKGTAKTAITLLGELQSERSAPFLVEYLTLGVFYKETKRLQTTDDFFPAVAALIRIGTASIEPVLKRAESTDDTTVLRNAALVVKGVLKTDALRVIEEHATRQSDPQARQRLALVEQYAKN